MPCRDWPEETPSGTEANRARAEIQKKLDDVNTLLCGVVSHLKQTAQPAYFQAVNDHVSGLNEWWEKHLEHDKLRIRGEIARELSHLPLEKLREIQKLMKTV